LARPALFLGSLTRPLLLGAPVALGFLGEPTGRLVEPALMVPGLRLPELLGVLAHLLCPLGQLREHPDLGPQHVGQHGPVHVVHGAERVPAGCMGLGLALRREEDDRRVFRLPALADERRGLEAVHAGHVDVEQNHGEVVAQEAPERVLSRPGGDHSVTERGQDRFQGQELVRAVIDHEDADHQRTFR
jgi:hypothetical protein